MATIKKKKFKGLDWCKKHKKYYHWYYKCEECKKENKSKDMKSIEQILKEMEKDNLIPKTLNDKTDSVDDN